MMRGSYELRLLKAPSVYVIAVWLKNLSGGDDIVLPVPEVAAATRSRSAGGGALPQTGKNFLQGLKPSASQALRFDSRPGVAGPTSPPPGSGGRPGVAGPTSPPPGSGDRPGVGRPVRGSRPPGSRGRKGLSK